jgi:hypothetical protein
MLLCVPLARSCCFTLLTWHVALCFPLLKAIVMLFLLDVVFCSSCSTYYSAPFIWCGVLLLLFDLLFHSSCSTCYFIPLVRPATPHSMWFSAPLVRLATPHSTWFFAPLVQLIALLFLFDLLFCSFCSTCCSAFLVQHVVLLLLLNLLFRSSCSTSCSSTFLLHSWFPCSFCLTLLFLFLFFQINISPYLLFCKRGVWRSCLNLNSSKQTWKVKIFVFNFCLLINLFYFLFCVEMVVDNVFVCCVQELFGHCAFNYTHCILLLHTAFHLHNCIVYFFSMLHLIFSLSITCKCLGWFSYS